MEGLESRELFSGHSTLHPDLVYIRPSSTASATNSSSVQGYTPSQIAHAYGFDKISFSGGSVKGDGSGQTIAIVDAYNDPNLSSDLSVFDTQFGLIGPASLRMVNQSGGSKLPSTDAGWAGEISLDVEWAHAIAPAANIVVVEANSDTASDLMAAVNTARNIQSVSVVTMSWGGSEFVSYSGGETSSQLTLDSTFTTPSGHTGVTFVASAGDSGFANGVQWPASSPNVVSVGGTSLQTSDSAGAYAGEGPWRGFANGTSGGFSQYEIEPTYQQNAQQSGSRSTPDVGYNADPNNGFAVYDSVPYQGYTGWQEVGGTSAGAPQWAALIAIADQGRALNGLGTLDGAKQTLPALYSVYSAPGTNGYSTYTSYYNDIGNDGYGYSTGLGSPKADQVVSLLVGSSTSGSSGSSGGSTSTTVTPTQQASPLSVSFVSLPSTSTALTGSTGTIKVRLTNISGARFSGPVTVTIYASRDGMFSSQDTVLGTLTLPSVNLRAFASQSVSVRYTYAASLAGGSYNLVASVAATNTGAAMAQVVSASKISVNTATVDLATTFASPSPLMVNPGHGENASVVLTNDGNVTANGRVNLSLYASSDDAIDANATLLAAITGRKISLRAGHSITLRVHFVAPAGSTSGSYHLIATTISSTKPADTDSSNDTAEITTA